MEAVGLPELGVEGIARGEVDLANGHVGEYRPDDGPGELPLFSCPCFLRSPDPEPAILAEEPAQRAFRIGLDCAAAPSCLVPICIQAFGLGPGLGPVGTQCGYAKAGRLHACRRLPVAPSLADAIVSNPHGSHPGAPPFAA